MSSASFLEQKRPADIVWLTLIEALTWIRYEHAVDLDALLSGAFDLLGLGQNEIQTELEQAWRRLADKATTGSVGIRGRRDGEKHECDLTVDDLRNCRHLAWTKLGQTARGGWLRESDDRHRMVVRVERHPDTAEGAWQRRVGDTAGHDYYDVVVLREALMMLFPASMPSVRRLKADLGKKEAARKWLASFCDDNPPKTKTRKDLIAHLKKEFRIPRRTADGVWTEVTATRPEWRAPGRPSKTIRGKSPAN